MYISNTNILKISINLFFIGLLVSCGGGGGGTGGGTGPSLNTPPVVSVSSSIDVNSGETVTLVAAATDENNDELTYKWIQTSGSRVHLDDEGASSATFLSPSSNGTLTFKVEVSDSKETTTSNDISINVLAYSGSNIEFTQNPFIENAAFSDANEVDVLGNVSYVAAGIEGMLIYDISSTTPQFIGGYTPSSINAYRIDSAPGIVAVYARISLDDGIYLIDTSTLSAPVLSGSIFTGVISIRDILLSEDGSMLYVATDSGIRIYDLSDPSNPTLVTLAGSFTFSEYSTSLELIETVASNTLFVFSKNASVGTLSIFDVTDPATSIPTLGSITGLEVLDKSALSNTALYASGLDGAGVEIFDVSNLTNPVKQGKWLDNGWAIRNVVVNQSTIYVADWFRGIAAIDVSNPSQPSIVGVYDTPGRAFDLAFHNNNILVADKDIGLQVVDVSSPSISMPVRSLGAASNGKKVIARNGSAYLVDQDSSGQGLIAYDVSDPLNPVVQGTFAEGITNKLTGAAYYGKYVITVGPYGLKIMDVSQPALMTVVGEYNLTSFAGYTSVVVNQNYAYVSNDSSPGRFYTFDLSDLSNPIIVDNDSIYEFDYNTIKSLEIDNTTLYIATTGGLYAADVTNPANPVMENTSNAILLGPTILGLATLADIAIIAQTSFQGNYVDLVDTSSLPAVSTISGISQKGNGIAISGRYMYVTEYHEFSNSTDLHPLVITYDISNPLQPTLAGFFELPEAGRTLDVADGYFYTVLETKGLAIMQAEPELSKRYTESIASDSLDYTVSWKEYPSSNNPEVNCIVTGGACSVTSIDQFTRTASITWSLPNAVGDHEIAVVIGDQHSFFSTKDRLKVF